jgi:hypothetical protein
MQKHGGWLSIIGCFGLVVAANAQTPSPPAANTRFDGTYAFVSSTKVNETFMGGGTRPSQCPDRTPGPLIIVNGQARYNYRRYTAFELEGTVGSQGELAMRREPELESRHAGIMPGIEFFAYGSIAGTGTARVRQIGPRCNYDFVWRKDPS